MVNAEEQPSEEAAVRWRKLKSKYQTDDDEAATRTVTSQRQLNPSRTATIRSIPDDEPQNLPSAGELADDPQWENETQIDEPRFTAKRRATRSQKPTEPPVPISEDDFQPAWIYGATAAAESEQASPALGDDRTDPQPPELNDADESRQSSEPDPGYARTEMSGRPRSIRDIVPTYDRGFDEDIRNFAREQARNYDVAGARPARSRNGRSPPRRYCGNRRTCIITRCTFRIRSWNATATPTAITSSR